LLAMSTDVGIFIDGTQGVCSNRNKNEFFSLLRNLRQTEQAIILYVDMLGEGIDVPGITGFLPIRFLSDTKFKQGVGRACRLIQADRERLYAGTLKPGSHGKIKGSTKGFRQIETGFDPTQNKTFVKPFAHVIVPQVLFNSEDYADRYKELLYVLCEEYGMGSELIFIDQTNGYNDRSALEPVNQLNRVRHATRSEIMRFYHEINEKIDRRMGIDELAFIDLLGAGRDPVTGKFGYGLKAAEAVFQGCELKDKIEEYADRSDRWKGVPYEGVSSLIEKAKKHKDDVFSDEMRRLYGTIYTPEFVVDKTLDLAFKYLPKEDRKSTRLNSSHTT